MCGESELGVCMHVVRANLHLERASSVSDHARMQRLVLIAFRTRDVVVELARHERPQRMHDAERGVTVRDVRHQYAQCANVVQGREFEPLFLHLPPDRIDMFRSSGDVGFDSGRAQCGFEFAAHARDPRFALATGFVEQVGDASVDIGLQEAEREILEFPLELPYAKPVRQRRVDVDREFGKRAPFRLGQFRRCAHAHELACKKNEYNTQVADDCEQQAAKSFGAAACTARGIQQPDAFGGALAFDEIDDLAAEPTQFGFRELDPGEHGRMQQHGNLCGCTGPQLFKQGQRGMSLRRTRTP